MSVTVEILAPTNPQKLQRMIGGSRKASFTAKPSKALRERIVVGWLSDLDSEKRRRILMNAVDLVISREDGVLVLIETKAGKAPSYAALETLALWAAHFGAYLAPDETAVRRMLLARAAGEEQRRIASALVEDGRLIVWSCEPKRYEVPVSQIPALASINPKQLKDFELNESGSCLHWEAADVDIDLDIIRYHVDPNVRRQQDKVTRDEVRLYARAIRALRTDHKLSQADIPGLTERQVRRIEQGESHPRSETLKKLAAAHGLSLNEYVGELARRSKRTAR